jgi:hypothetical protein
MRYGVRWQDGGVTGGITGKYRLAAGYAKNPSNPVPGTVYQVDDKDEPMDGVPLCDDTEEAEE